MIPTNSSSTNKTLLFIAESSIPKTLDVPSHILFPPLLFFSKLSEMSPVVMHFHKACRKDMLKKTSHKLHDIKMNGAPALATIFLVDEEDLTTFHLYDSTVLDGNFESIKRRTFDTLLAAADRLAVHVPGEIPDFRGIEAKRLAFFISSRNLDMNIVDMALIGR